MFSHLNYKEEQMSKRERERTIKITEKKKEKAERRKWVSAFDSRGVEI